MADRGINESEVYRFIHEKIDTVPHLEALLQLRQSGPRKWTEEQLARRLFISTETAGKILRDLARLQLVAVEAGEPPRYSYRSDSGTDDLVAAVFAAYQRDLPRMTAAIHAKTKHERS